MKKMIEQLRDDLHKEIESKDKDSEKILKLSKELDDLIIKYLKEDSPDKNK